MASRNIVHFLKKVILRCIDLCFHYHHLYLLSRLDQPLIQRIPAGLSSTVACLDINHYCNVSVNTNMFLAIQSDTELNVGNALEL